VNIIDSLRPTAYKVNARWLPAMMIALPVVALLAGVLYRFVPWNNIEQVPWKAFGSFAGAFIVIGVASIVLFAEKIRDRGKHLQEEYFCKASAFPTTEFLLWSNDTIELEIKKLLHTAIRRDFDIRLCSCEEEGKDISKARRLICSAVNQIRESVKDGRLLIDYNIRYGYYRNIIGSADWGMALAIVCNIVSLFIGNVYVFTAEASLIFYFLLLLYKREEILNEYSQEYARRLFSEYMAWSYERKKMGQLSGHLEA